MIDDKRRNMRRTTFLVLTMCAIIIHQEQSYATAFLSSPTTNGFGLRNKFLSSHYPAAKVNKTPLFSSSSESSVEKTTTTDDGEEEKDNTAQNLYRKLEQEFNYEGRISSEVSLDEDEDVDDFRCGFVSIVGAPNMGKSTLMNALLQEDLCVATRRPQTTRHAILGILTDRETSCQIAFTDTPGVIDDPAYKLQEGMMEAVRGALSDADVLLVVTDLFSTPIPDDALFAKLQLSNKPIVVVVNKIDLLSKVNPDKKIITNEEGEKEDGKTYSVEDAVSKWRTLLPKATAIIPLSAASEESDSSAGVTLLRRLLSGGPDVPAAIRALGRPIPGMFKPGCNTVTDEEAKRLIPISPPLYDEDTLTDRSERFFASEMIRASLFEKLGKELPYCCEVRISEFKEPKETDKKQIIRIRATVFVERDSQKGIVVGKGGSKIKDVGMDARRKLEEFLQTSVHLELTVKVDKDWRRNEDRLKEFGYLK